MITKRKDRTFLLLLKVLILNLPLFSLVLLRYMGDVSPSSYFYVFSLFIGYYFIVQLVLTLPAFLVIYFKRLSIAIAWFVLSLLLYFYIVDSIVFSIYRFHINYFFIELFFIDFENFGFTTGMLAMGIGALLLSFAFEFGIFYLAKKISNKLIFLIIPIVLLFLASQLIHIFAFANNRSDITSLTPKLPLYFPVTSSSIAGKNQKLGSNIGLGSDISKINKDNATINYPKKEFVGEISGGKDPLPNIIFIVLESWRFDMLDSLYCPNIYNLSRKSTYLAKHFSTGNSTTSGIFGIFYGLHPTYWEAVKANNNIIDNPVFIDVLKKNNYDFGIYSHSNFKRFKLKASIFNGLQLHNSFRGSEDWEIDDNMNKEFIEYINSRINKKNPFFSFIFYTSTHHAYSYPEDSKYFSPTGKINMGLVNNATDPTPYLNAYKNSIHYVDKLVEDVLNTLKNTGLDSNTIIVLTSDHGEEFNDNQDNYWGHGSNFTKYQCRVPLMMYFPDKRAQIVSNATSHIDIAPTLLQEVFHLEDNISAYSSGKNIFHLKNETRPFVVSSYVNHALIIGDNVYAVYPFALTKYKLDNIKQKVNKTDAKLFRKAIDEMNWFYK